MKIHRYFFSFYYQKEEIANADKPDQKPEIVLIDGQSAAVIDRERPICDENDILEATNAIRKQTHSVFVVPIFFTKLEEKPDGTN